MLRYVHSLCMQSTWLAQPLTRICPMLFQYCHVSLHIFACKWLMGIRPRYVLLYLPINLQTLHATVSSLRKVRECGDMHAQKAKTSHTVILMMRAWAVWERNYFVAALLVFLFLVSGTFSYNSSVRWGLLAWNNSVHSLVWRLGVSLHPEDALLRVLRFVHKWHRMKPLNYFVSS